MAKLTEAKKRANKRWAKKNKERMNYLRVRGFARTFVRHHSVDVDVLELINIYRNENENSKDILLVLKEYLEKELTLQKK